MHPEYRLGFNERLAGYPQFSILVDTDEGLFVVTGEPTINDSFEVVIPLSSDLSKAHLFEDSPSNYILTTVNSNITNNNIHKVKREGIYEEYVLTPMVE